MAEDPFGTGGGDAPAMSTLFAQQLKRYIPNWQSIPDAEIPTVVQNILALPAERKNRFIADVRARVPRYRNGQYNTEQDLRQLLSIGGAPAGNFDQPLREVPFEQAVAQDMMGGRQAPWGTAGLMDLPSIPAAPPSAPPPLRPMSMSPLPAHDTAAVPVPSIPAPPAATPSVPAFTPSPDIAAALGIGRLPWMQGGTQTKDDPLEKMLGEQRAQASGDHAEELRRQRFQKEVQEGMAANQQRMLDEAAQRLAGGAAPQPGVVPDATRQPIVSERMDPNTGVTFDSMEDQQAPIDVAHPELRMNAGQNIYTGEAPANKPMSPDVEARYRQILGELGVIDQNLANRPVAIDKEAIAREQIADQQRMAQLYKTDPARYRLEMAPNELSGEGGSFTKRQQFYDKVLAGEFDSLPRESFTQQALTHLGGRLAENLGFLASGIPLSFGVSFQGTPQEQLLAAIQNKTLPEDAFSGQPQERTSLQDFGVGVADLAGTLPGIMKMGAGLFGKEATALLRMNNRILGPYVSQEVSSRIGRALKEAPKIIGRDVATLGAYETTMHGQPVQGAESGAAFGTASALSHVLAAALPKGMAPAAQLLVQPLLTGTTFAGGNAAINAMQGKDWKENIEQEFGKGAALGLFNAILPYAGKIGKVLPGGEARSKFKENVKSAFVNEVETEYSPADLHDIYVRVNKGEASAQEEALVRNINIATGKDVGAALRKGVTVSSGEQYKDWTPGWLRNFLGEETQGGVTINGGAERPAASTQPVRNAGAGTDAPTAQSTQPVQRGFVLEGGQLPSPETRAAGPNIVTSDRVSAPSSQDVMALMRALTTGEPFPGAALALKKNADIRGPVKKAPEFKNFMQAQIAVLQKAGIPEERIADYAQDSIADGKKLRSYAEDVLAGKIGAEEAAVRVRADYEKMINGEKPAENLNPQEPASHTQPTTPIKSGIVAGQRVNLNPSDAQKAVGNYVKGKTRWNGLKLTVENPKGSLRSGTDASGKPWSTTMNNDYGYIKGFQGRDKDHVDFFMGDNPDSDFVFIVDQQQPNTKKLDEHKVMLGFDGQEDAQQAYLSNYDPTWLKKQGGAVGGVATNVDGLRDWLQNADKSSRAESHKFPAAAQPPAPATPAKLPETPAAPPVPSSPESGGKAEPVVIQGTASGATGEATAGPRYVKQEEADAVRNQIEELRAEASAIEAAGKGKQVWSDRHQAYVGVGDRGITPANQKKIERLRKEAVALENDWWGALNPDQVGETEIAEASAAGLPLLESSKPSAKFPDTPAANPESSTPKMEEPWTPAPGDKVQGQHNGKPVSGTLVEKAGGMWVKLPDGQMPSFKQADWTVTEKAPPAKQPTIDEYIQGIRSKVHRQYAEAYRRFIEEGGPEPKKPDMLPTRSATEVKTKIPKLTKSKIIGTLPVGGREFNAFRVNGDIELRSKARGEDGAPLEIRRMTSQQYESEVQKRGKLSAAGRQRAASSIRIDPDALKDMPATRAIFGMNPNVKSGGNDQVGERFEGVKIGKSPVSAKPLFDPGGPTYDKLREFLGESDDPTHAMWHIQGKDFNDLVDIADDEIRRYQSGEIGGVVSKEELRHIEQLLQDHGLSSDEINAEIEKVVDYERKRLSGEIVSVDYNFGIPEVEVPFSRRDISRLSDDDLAAAIRAALKGEMPELFSRVGTGTLDMFDPQQDLFDLAPKPKQEELPETPKPDPIETEKKMAATALAEQASMFDAEPTPPRAKPSAKPQATGKEITDFGEKIGGARKDYAATFEAAKTLDIEKYPLSKVWPEPNYAALIADGADPLVVGFMRAARDEVPTKPVSGWKMRNYVNEVESLRGMAEKLASGQISKESLLKMLDEPQFERVKQKVLGRAELYAALGHDQSLKGITLQRNHYSVYHGETNVVKWQVEKKGVKTAFSNMPTELGVGNTKEEAIAAFRGRLLLEAAQTLDHAPVRGKTEFEIYHYRSKSGYMIGKKMATGYIDLFSFDTPTEARAFLKDHYAEVAKRFEDFKKIGRERKSSNSARIGADYRGGRDVTPDHFQGTFGFRGVEFGNYVEQSRRQADLNDAFDGLMDLAGVLNVPPRAMSLDGQLGLAFGARGHGGKNAPAAHYELDRVVINLTKHGGPGSLAHEWWHAVDNYFARQGGDRLGMLTVHRSVQSASNGFPYSNGSPVRREMFDAYGAVVKAIRESGLPARSTDLDLRRSSPYWSKLEEMTARAFENYVIDRLAAKAATNDYLANVNSVSSFASDMLDAFMGGKTAADVYPYLLDAEREAVGKAYDKFFEAVQTRETEKGVELYSKRTPEEIAKSEVFARSQSHQGWKGDVSTFLRGELKRDEHPQIEYIPDAVRLSGIIPEGRPLIMLASMMKKSMQLGKDVAGKHDIPREIMERLPELLGRPVMIGRSMSKKPEDAGKYVVVLDVLHKNQPVVAIINPDARLPRYTVAMIDSVYERPFADLENWSKAGWRLTYGDNKKMNRWVTEGKLQLLPMVSPSGSRRNISNEIELVKSLHTEYVKKVYPDEYVEGETLEQRRTPDNTLDMFGGEEQGKPSLSVSDQFKLENPDQAVKGRYAENRQRAEERRAANEEALARKKAELGQLMREAQAAEKMVSAATAKRPQIDAFGAPDQTEEEARQRRNIQEQIKALRADNATKKSLDEEIDRLKRDLAYPVREAAQPSAAVLRMRKEWTRSLEYLQNMLDTGEYAEAYEKKLADFEAAVKAKREGRADPKSAERAQRIKDLKHDIARLVMDLDEGLFENEGGQESLFQIRAYHGSPHSFDRFDISKIGTGEGAQAFGHGLYFADKKSIARHYADRLSHTRLPSTNDITINTSSGAQRAYVDAFQGTPDGYYSIHLRARDLIAEGVQMGKANPAKYAEKRAEQYYRDRLENTDPRDERQKRYYQTMYDGLRSGEITFTYEKEPSRNLYKVTIHKGKAPSEYKYLDWNKPLSEQPEDVQRIVKSLLPKPRRLHMNWQEQDFERDGGKRYEARYADLDGQTMRARVDEYETERGDIYAIAKVSEYGHGWVELASFESAQQAKSFFERGTREGMVSVYDRAKLNGMIGVSDAAPGEAIYHALSRKYGSPEAASRALYEAGISGNKYLSQGGTGGSTAAAYNYVVFSDADVNVEQHDLYKKRGTEPASSPVDIRQREADRAYLERKIPDEFLARMSWDPNMESGQIEGGYNPSRDEITLDSLETARDHELGHRFWIRWADPKLRAEVFTALSTPEGRRAILGPAFESEMGRKGYAEDKRAYEAEARIFENVKASGEYARTRARAIAHKIFRFLKGKLQKWTVDRITDMIMGAHRLAVNVKAMLGRGVGRQKARYEKAVLDFLNGRGLQAPGEPNMGPRKPIDRAPMPRNERALPNHMKDMLIQYGERLWEKGLRSEAEFRAAAVKELGKEIAPHVPVMFKATSEANALESRRPGAVRLYHGTPAKWKHPKLGRPGVFWLTEDQAAAQTGYARGGDVKAFDVQLGKVADLTQDQKLYDALRRIYNSDPEIAADPERKLSKSDPQQASVLNSAAVLAELKRRGYNSVKVFEDKTVGETSYAVFDTNQLQPANATETSRKDQTKSPEFKKWFGDSKVVGEHGKPLVVYHGTPKSFSKFRLSRNGIVGRGIYLTTNPVEADEFTHGDGSNIMPLYASIQRPYKMDFRDTWADLYRDLFGDDPDNRDDEYPNRQQEKKIHDQLAAWGHDGFEIYGAGDNGTSTFYVAFSPDQVKSAAGNRGTFDPSDPNILHSLRDDAVPSTEELSNDSASLPENNPDGARIGALGKIKGAYDRFCRSFTIDPVPGLEAAGVADEAVQHAAAKIAVPHMVDALMDKVFTEMPEDDQAHFVDILNKDNILGGYDEWMRKTDEARKWADDLEDPSETVREYQDQLADIAELATEDAGYAKEARELKRLIFKLENASPEEREQARADAKQLEQAAEAIAAKHDLDAYDAEVREAAKDPAIKKAAEAWRMHVNTLLDRLYNEAKQVDPETERDGRGRIIGARINLLPGDRAEHWQKFASDASTPLPEGSPSSYRNPNTKRDTYMRQAFFTGEYSTDPRMVLTAVLGPRWNEVTKVRLYNALERKGVAQILEPGDEAPAEIQGQPIARLPIKVPETGSDGRTRMVERSMVVRRDLVREIRDALNTDQPNVSNPLFRAATSLQLMQIADAVTHAKNLQTVVGRAQGAGSVWIDVARKLPIINTFDALARIIGVSRQILTDAPGIKDEIAELAKMGAIRPEYPATGVSKFTHAQQFLHKMDTATRVVMNRFYDNLVERGLVEDSENERRKFANQAGMYNRRLMGPVMRAMRDVGIAPFIVAGRNFNRQGVRHITGDPGIKAKTWQAAMEMRAVNLFGTFLVLAVVPALLNYLTTGKMGGRNGTQIGAWDLGTEKDEKGKHQVIDLAQWTGLRRGLRLTGMDALMNGIKDGKDINTIGGEIRKQSMQNMAHPWVGPGAAFFLKTVGGFQPDIRGEFAPEYIPAGGIAQDVENMRAALESQNPLLYSLGNTAVKAVGGKGAEAIKDEGQNFLKVLLKSPMGALGIKEVKGETAAESMMRRLLRDRMPAQRTAESIERSKLVNGYIDRMRKAKTESEKAAVRRDMNASVREQKMTRQDFGRVNRDALRDAFQLQFNRLPWSDAEAVFEAMTPEERSKVENILTMKRTRHNAGLADPD